MQLKEWRKVCWEEDKGKTKRDIRVGNFSNTPHEQLNRRFTPRVMSGGSFKLRRDLGIKAGREN